MGPEQLGAFARGFSELTGAFGVGSLWLLALFLALDASANAYAVVESTAGTASWSAFVAVPLLVAAYVAGVISTALGARLRGLLYRGDPDQDARRGASLASLESGFLFDRFSDFTLRRTVLDGAAPALVGLSAAVVLEGYAWGLANLGLLLALPALSAGFIALVLSERLGRDFDRLLAASAARPQEATG